MNHQFVKCRTMTNEEKLINKTDLSFRPSSYGLIVHEERLLLTVVKTTGKYTPPGGGVDIGETLEFALKREIKEECGIEVVLQKPLFFHETFFYYEPTNSAFQFYLFFFLGRSKTLDLSDANNVQDDTSIQPQWVEITKLHPSDFQICGEQILAALKSL